MTGRQGMASFDELESAVRSYCRAFPTVFTRAVGSTLYDEHGRTYLDFLSGAGALNYGHNPPQVKRRLVEYLEADGITHALDLATAAKREFLERFVSTILAPRGLEYRIQFTGPTGTNAVEAALKLVRKVTGRRTVAYFAGAFHGMTLGSLSVNGDPEKRRSAGVPLGYTLELPYDGDHRQGVESLDVLEEALRADGAERPAAVILETVQAEGGVKVATPAWLRRLARLTREHGVLLVVDDIQVGCGRTGPFFSFERAGIAPDVVCLSKSISGYGIPMSLLLIRPDLDVWRPGEHNGTFRGHNLAFVAGTACLEMWEDDGLSRAVAEKGERIRRELAAIAAEWPAGDCRVRGLGLIQGIELPDGVARRVSEQAFQRGLIVETAGPRGNVLKLLPPLIVSDADLEEGLGRLREAVDGVIGRRGPAAA